MQAADIVPSRSSVMQWGLLALLSALFGTAAVSAGLSGGILVSAMAASVLMGLRGARIEVPLPVFGLAQGIIGCVIASTLEISVLQSIGLHLWPMVASVTLTMLAAVATGIVLARWGSLPGSTGVWGIMPGAASAMSAMSADFGGDPRIVALMQYTRVLIVVLSTTAVSHLLMQPGESAPPLTAAGVHTAQGWLAWIATAETLVIAVAGAMLGRALRIPAGTLFMPLVLGSVFKLSGTIDLHVPYWLSIVAFCTIGWTIGLKFRRNLLLPLVRTMPAIIVGILALIFLCGVSGWVLTLMAGVSPMTAYLATSPGGLDSVSALALSVQADMPFVVALQTFRLFVVILVGPFVGRWLARAALA